MKSWKEIGKIIVFFLICLMAWQMKFCYADAAGANISIKTENTTIKKGDIFYVIITVDSPEEMNGFEGYFSYNQSVMKYITGGTVSSGNDDEFSVSDMNREESSTEFKYSIQFQARRAGSSTIALQSPYAVYRAEDSSKMPVASNILNILVVKEKQIAALQKPMESAKPTDILTEDEGALVPPEADVSIDDQLPPQEEVTHQPELDADDEGMLEDALPMQTRKPLSYEENEEEKNGEAFSESIEGKEGENPNKDISTTLIIFLLIFSVCLLVAIIIGLLFMKNQGMEEEQWKAEEIWDTEEDNERTEEDVAEEQKEISDISKEHTESLEEIEKRLEKKRNWLRK